MLFDTYAWIEFFNGSKAGERVELLLKSEPCFTSILTIAELTKWCIRNNFDVERYINSVEKASVILNLNTEICVLAGKINSEMREKVKDFGMIDALIISTAKLYDLRVLTGDPHFKDFGAEML